MIYFSDFGGSVVSSNQWRILFVDGVSGTEMPLIEVVMREAVSGVFGFTNDLCNGGTVTASGGTDAYKAFDNDTGGGNFWYLAPQAATVGAWLQYTFPAPVTVREICMRMWTYGAGQPRHMRVQCYSGGSWVTSFEHTNTPTDFAGDIVFSA